MIEAQAAGKPVISTKVGGIENVVIDSKTGLLSGIEQPALFFRNLYSLLENDNLRSALGKSGIETTERFGYPRLVSEMKNFYLSLLNKS